MPVMSSPSSVRQEVKPQVRLRGTGRGGRLSMAGEGTGEREGPGQVKAGHTALSPVPTARYCHLW